MREQAVQPDLPSGTNRAQRPDVPPDVAEPNTDRLDAAEIAAEPNTDRLNTADIAAQANAGRPVTADRSTGNRSTADRSTADRSTADRSTAAEIVAEPNTDRLNTADVAAEASAGRLTGVEANAADIAVDPDAEATAELIGGELPLPQPVAESQPLSPEPAAPARAAYRPPRQPLRVHLPFILVLTIAAAGVIRIAQYHWREGSVLLGGALLVAALLRAVLPATRAGLMAVRGRAVDVLTYTALAACVLFIAITLQSGPNG